MTNLQTKLIHIACRQAGMNDAQYRTLLRNAAGVESSKQLDQAGFEDVMAVLEDCGFVDRTHGRGYWRGKVEARGRKPGERMAMKIRQLSEGSKYPLEALCRRFSDGRTDDLERLLPREAWKLIEMLKACVARASSPCRENMECQAAHGQDAHATGAPPTGAGKDAPQGRGGAGRPVELSLFSDPAGSQKAGGAASRLAPRTASAAPVVEGVQGSGFGVQELEDEPF